MACYLELAVLIKLKLAAALPARKPYLMHCSAISYELAGSTHLVMPSGIHNKNQGLRFLYQQIHAELRMYPQEEPLRRTRQVEYF